MARPKFQTLTEQMFYCLLALQRECCGMDIMDRVPAMTGGRVTVGSGTLYHLLDQFLASGMICETKVEGRRRSYLLTEKGRAVLEEEVARLRRQLEDYGRIMADYQAATTATKEEEQA
ncbi:MAG: PadR family transcriptional regulator [Clostridia bacterium]|nr:PadR family transcriptional regulator [Clostridia bacterium]